LSCERYLEIEGKPFKFEHCVETLHKVAKYNPLFNEEPLSSDDEAAADRNRVTGVMGGTLERPQGRKAAKADAAAKRRSNRKTTDDDDLEAETEAAAASRIADSFQSLTNSMVSGQEFDRLERAIKLLREQGRHALAERKTDELLSRLENEDAEKTTTATEVSPVVLAPPPTRPLTPPPPLPPSPPSSPDERGAGCYSPTTTSDCEVDDIADGISALQEDFTPSRVATTLPPPTRLPSSLVVFIPPTPAAATLTPTVTVTTERSSVLVVSKRWAARRERTRLALADKLEAEATHGPSPTPNEEDDGESTVVGVVGRRRGKVSPVPEESSQLKWGTIDTNPIVWGSSKE
jgi:hypothetical protein